MEMNLMYKNENSLKNPHNRVNVFIPKFLSWKGIETLQTSLNTEIDVKKEKSLI